MREEIEREVREGERETFFGQDGTGRWDGMGRGGGGEAGGRQKRWARAYASSRLWADGV